MWSCRSEELADGRGIRCVLTHKDAAVSVANVHRAWEADVEFRTWFNQLLADVPFSAFRWETPAVTTITANRPFEFVMMNDLRLDRQPDPTAFAEYFRSEVDGTEVVEFTNLGGDAILVVPCPVAETTAYGHLGAFVRKAPEKQRHAFWKTVGAKMNQRIGNKPVWLNTAGAGVPWLHMRLDDRPKYYRYSPYQQTER